MVGLDARDDASTIATPLQRWSFDVNDGAAAQRARREFHEALRDCGVAREDVFTAEIVFGELVGNVVRYAAGPVDVSVDLSAASPVLHVLDRGPGFRHIALLPLDVYSETGRGLFLVSALTEDFRVSKRANGGSHARAVLALERTRLAPPTVPIHSPLLGGVVGGT